jgi:Intracellular proteinase inhibitor
LHLVEAYFPLQVGNRWTYEVMINGKKRPKPVVVEINRMVIKNFRSYYLFNRFPFAPGPESETPFLRFDRKTQTFFQLVNEREVELYPGDGENRVEVKAGESPSGQVDLRILKAEFQAAPPSPSQQAMTTPSEEVVFKYGEGIISARRTTQFGVEEYTLLKAEKNEFPSTPPSPTKEPAPEESSPTPKEPPSPYASTGPVLSLEVNPERGRTKFILRVRNEKDKMIPLSFDNDQSFDFIITPETSDQPLWRWSVNHSFAKVKRSVGLRPGESLEYSGEWNGLDADHQPVPPGKYRVIAILTSKPEWRTAPAEFNFTPAPSR